MSQQKPKSKHIMELQLGDIIKIKDPTNERLNDQIFLIQYLDSNVMKLINTDNLDSYSLSISPDKILGNGSIESIELLSREKEKGFAKQNNLIPGTWIELYFGGEIPTIITGEITNVEQDMIEIKTYPEGDILYINFDYKGIPLDLPIESITIREKPKDVQWIKNPVSQDNSELEEGEIQEEKLPEEQPLAIPQENPELEEGEILEEKLPEEQPQDKPISIRNQVRELILNANQIKFGNEEFGPIVQYKSVDENKQRYSIETQTNDLLDELLSTIPNSKRTNSVLNNIHIMIERFKQLRNVFSTFDENGNIESAFLKKSDYKPLEKYFQSFQNNLYWILPVVQNIKKIYSLKSDIFNSETNDTIEILFQEDIEKMMNIIDIYKSKNNKEEQNKYVSLYTELNPYFTPFDYISNENQENILLEKRVGCNMNTLINNLENFYSTVYSKNELITRKFLIQKYNLGLNQLENITSNRNQTTSILTNLTDPDILSLQSFLMLPEPIIRFSQINLPGTNILDRAVLNKVGTVHYWELFSKSFSFDTILVDNTEQEINFSELNFANKSKQFVLGEQQLNVSNEISKSKEKIYSEFINTIIPKTKVLFQLMKKYMVDKFSILSVVECLEPFFVYSDDITYMQYVEMVRFVYEKISEFIKEYLEKAREFGNFKRKKENNMILKDVFSLSQLLSDSSKDEIMSDYGVIENSSFFMDNSEMLRIILLKDEGRLWNTVLSLQNISLMFASNLDSLFDQEKLFNEKQLDGTKDKEKGNDREKCKNFIISKIYYSENELLADNKKEIYFDKKYDKTNYGLLEEYEKEMLNLPPDNFLDYLTKKLSEKYHLDDVKADYLADTLINGFKRVQNGDYAILYHHSQQPPSYTYYKRIHEEWIKDDSIDQKFLQSVNSDDTGILCDLQESCIQKIDRSSFNQGCESIQENKLQLKESILNQIINEFDQKYSFSKEELEENLKKDLNYYATIYFPKLLKIEKETFLFYNNQQYEIGLSSQDEMKNILVSPYASLRDMILGQQDFVKKQNDIIQFVEMFCRKSIPDSISVSTGLKETEHWLYCIKTNIELLPIFYYDLACAFMNTPNDYFIYLQKMIVQIGVLSEDGDAWTDKFTGREICKIDYSFEEGYEESGFRAETRGILEKDAGDSLFTSSISKPKVYDSIEMKIISNIVNTVSLAMGINLENQKDFIINGVLESLQLHLEKEETYQKRVKEMIQKGSKTNFPSYPDLYNTTLLFFTLGFYLIAVQTNIPSIKSRKTFPGCIRSFSGYPMEGEGDLSSLHYLSCIVYAIRKNSADPWSSIKNTKENAIATKIKNAIDLILVLPSVVSKMDEKTAYLLLNPEKDIPFEHEVSQAWIGFLPPLKMFKINKINNISSEFESSLLKDLKTGNPLQREKVLVIQSKNILFSLAIQEKIQDIVSKKSMILNKSNNEPYLENACCNENIQTQESFLSYFENIDSTISSYNSFVIQLTNILTDIHFYSEANMFSTHLNTKKIFPSLNQQFDEKIIYLGFIDFCRFTSLIPIEENLLPICTDKPTFLNKNDSLNTMIQKLKNDGRNYTEAMFLRLLQIISRNNIIPISDIFHSTLKSSILRFTDVLENMNAEKEEVVPKTLRDLLYNSLDTYHLATDKITDETKNLNNFLIKSNIRLKEELIEFIVQNKGASTKKEEKQILSFIQGLAVWGIETHDKEVPRISNSTLYTMVSFYKEMIQDIVLTFPNIILNQVNYNEISLPNYWGLSQHHAKDIKTSISQFYSCLRNFYNDDSLITLLKFIQVYSKNILLLSKETPSYTSIHYKEKELKPVLDERTSKYLFEFYLLKTLTTYMELSEQENMVTTTKTVEREVDELFSVEYLNDQERKVNYDITQNSEKDLVLLRGNVKQLKQKIAKLLVCFLKIMKGYKDTIDISYSDIQDRIFRLKEKEKNMITDRLQFNITDEEREADTILKINKLGVWSKGLEKGLKTYVKDHYDKEREFMETMMQYEKKVVSSNKIGLEDFEDYKDDYLSQIQQEEDIEREAYDMSHMTDDYENGNDYEGDEVEQEDYDDYN